jgi:hypothetical protein
MHYRVKKIGAAFVVLTTSASIAFASCGGTEGVVSSAVAEMAATVSAALTVASTAIVATDAAQTQSLLAAMKVMTRQVDISSTRSASVAVDVAKSEATFAKALSEKEIVDKVVMDFTSQGFDPCGQSSATKRLAVAEGIARNAVPSRVLSEIDAGGGKFGSVADVLVAREKQHQEMFCTQDEVSSGVCKSLGILPGGDSNAALLFDGSTDATTVAGRNAVINNIIGMPSAGVPVSAINSPEAASYLLEKKQKDAFLAFPSYSLKSIQTDNEKYKAVMDERMGQYFGTDRASQWAKNQAGQAQRGVLVDLVKIQGLQLKVRERRLRQGLRTEANLAALLALENRQINGPATLRAAQQASDHSDQLQVK